MSLQGDSLVEDIEVSAPEGVSAVESTVTDSSVSVVSGATGMDPRTRKGKQHRIDALLKRFKDQVTDLNQRKVVTGRFISERGVDLSAVRAERDSYDNAITEFTAVFTELRELCEDDFDPSIETRYQETHSTSCTATLRLSGILSDEIDETGSRYSTKGRSAPSMGVQISIVPSHGTTLSEPNDSVAGAAAPVTLPGPGTSAMYHLPVTGLGASISVGLPVVSSIPSTIPIYVGGHAPSRVHAPAVVPTTASLSSTTSGLSHGGPYTPVSTPVSLSSPVFGGIPVTTRAPIIGPFTGSSLPSYANPVPGPQVSVPTDPMQGYNANIAMHDAMRALVEQVTLSRVPCVEPPVFSGEVTEYVTWRDAFMSLITGKGIPKEERLHHLNKYLSASARTCIASIFMLSSPTAFDDAMALLDERFGNPFVIGDTYRTKLDDWPKIGGRDGTSLRKFVDFLRQCETAKATVPGLEYLDDCREIRKLQEKLPDWIVNRWARIVADVMDAQRRTPSFSEFVKFLKKESDIVNNPMTSLGPARGKNTSSDAATAKPNDRKQTSRARSLATGQAAEPAAGAPARRRLSCYCCSEGHMLHNCKQFLGMTVAARRDFVKRERLCFGCLGKGHMTKECTKKKTCDTCKRKHPTALHDPNGPPNLRANATSFTPKEADPPASVAAPTAVATATTFHTRRGRHLSCMIVPVYLSHKQNPNRKQLVYALLDSQSDTSFVLTKACRELGVTGVSTTLSLSTMHAQDKLIESERVKGLVVKGYNCNDVIELPPVYTRDIMPANRAHIPCASMADNWEHLKEVAEQLMPVTSDCEVALLIGYNCQRALIPRQVVASPTYVGPFAQRTDLGWGIVGIVDGGDGQPSSGTCHQVNVTFIERAKEIVSPRDVLNVLERDFLDNKQGVGLSVEDTRFLKIVSEGITQLPDSHYQMPLPFKADVIPLQNNIGMALKRLSGLKTKLDRNPDFKQEYTQFMADMLAKGYCSEVPASEYNCTACWFIPHHGVYGNGKLRVVFDCSAKHNGISLNDCLLQGPDLTNNLLGVLARFRKEQIAIGCDIRKMFYQFKVVPKHRDYMRFLWYRDGDTGTSPIQLRMNGNTFGAACSPGLSNFGLKKLASDYEVEFGSDVKEFIHNDFYVDDGMTSVATVNDAVDLVQRTIGLCAKGNLQVHKFVSNSREVLSRIDKDCRSDNIKAIDLSHDSLPMERALGMEWCVESDTFRFRLGVKPHPITRRGLLSTVASIYDPLGLISPAILPGRRILQHLCLEGYDWDDEPPIDIVNRWKAWLADLEKLREAEIPRAVKPADFVVHKVEFHHFSDGSLSGYGFCSYLRLLDPAGNIVVSLVFAKSKVAPTKPTTVPRLELAAAVLAVRASLVLDYELKYPSASHYFWTDSKVVLGYIANQSRRFHLFVSNRVGFIHTHTNINQWGYVPTGKNPADIASRADTGDRVLSPEWFNGPEFLRVEPVQACDTPVAFELSDDDKEVRKATSFASSVTLPASDILDRLDRIASYPRLIRVVALVFKFFLVTKRYIPRQGVQQSITVRDLRYAETKVIILAQEAYFSDDIKALSKGEQLLRSNPLYNLDPFVDADGLLKVGGRLRRCADLDANIKHPVILPPKSHLTQLLIKHCHELVKHAGKGTTLNEIRQRGFWIISGASVVKRYVHTCVACRKLRACTQGQKLADLPADRVENTPPFTNVGVDYFGPFMVKEGRKQYKRYGVLYTCLVSRAVHIEVAHSLTTSSFIHSLRRFISIRGPIAVLRCDQGTNFIGACNEFRNALANMEDNGIKSFLLKNQIEFRFNPPSASHFGGVWERLIRSVRSILDGTLLQCSHLLDDESLRTFMCEAAAILNGRPLTVDNLNDPEMDVLTPNHLLTMKSRVLVSPPGVFCKADTYCVKRWRRVQYLVDQFWTRFRREYLHVLQTRRKWQAQSRNLACGDIVLIKDDNQPRNMWSLGRVVEAKASDDNLVRSVKVLLADRNLDKAGKRIGSRTVYERPVHKLVLLLESASG